MTRDEKKQSGWRVGSWRGAGAGRCPPGAAPVPGRPGPAGQGSPHLPGQPDPANGPATPGGRGWKSLENPLQIFSSSLCPTGHQSQAQQGRTSEELRSQLGRRRWRSRTCSSCSVGHLIVGTCNLWLFRCWCFSAWRRDQESHPLNQRMTTRSHCYRIPYTLQLDENKRFYCSSTPK